MSNTENVKNTAVIQYLNFLVKEYEGVTQLIAQTHQRLGSLPGAEDDTSADTLLKGQEKEEGLETIKGRIVRELEKQLKQWDIWVDYLKQVPGIGPWMGAKLIILFNYRFVAVCQKCQGDLVKEEGTLICSSCGESSKKDGLLKYRLDFKDFPTISKWWAYMGRHTVEGIMPKRAKGMLANWSSPGRTLGFHIGDQFNRQQEDNSYKAFLAERKKKHAKNHPEWSKGHVHNAAKNETVKLFLAHFWHVSRTMEGKSVSEPYAGAIMGHTNIIKPFYWDGLSQDKDETQTDYASQGHHETYDQHA